MEQISACSWLGPVCHSGSRPARLVAAAYAAASLIQSHALTRALQWPGGALFGPAGGAPSTTGARRHPRSVRTLATLSGRRRTESTFTFAILQHIAYLVANLGAALPRPAGLSSRRLAGWLVMNLARYTGGQRMARRNSAGPWRPLAALGGHWRPLAATGHHWPPLARVPGPSPCDLHDI